MRWLPIVALCACGSEPAFRVTPVEHPRGYEVTGGTLLLAEQGAVAIASDADSDRVFIVEVGGLPRIRGTVQLPAGSRPARMALENGGDVYVALRGTGQVAKISVGGATLLWTKDVCGDPRSLAWDRSAGVMRIACGSGFVAELPPDGAPQLSRRVPDLRDVIVTPRGVFYTTFRGAELIHPNGTTVRSPRPTIDSSASLTPTVAWRTEALPDGTLVMAHQWAVDGPVEALRLTGGAAAAPSGASVYGSATGGPDAGGPFDTCSSPVVRSAVTFFRDDTVSMVGLHGVLPVDLAVSPKGDEVVVALAGTNTLERFAVTEGSGTTRRCLTRTTKNITAGGTPTGVAWLPDGTLLVHVRGSQSLLRFIGAPLYRDPIWLDASPLQDPGRDFFHTAVNGVACASCHPEGRDDGHVWVVKGQIRRTSSLAGGVLATAPFHWKGELRDVREVLRDTFVERMGGSMPEDGVVNELANWLDGIARPAPTISLDDPRLTRGRALFENAGCKNCHTGETLSSPSNVDVGTGGLFQVPSLRGVGSRGPWLHNGSLRTLRDRFRNGGGDRHGTTSHLSSEDIDALTAYLESL